MTVALTVITLITCGLLLLCGREARLRRATQQVAARLLAHLDTYRTPGDSTHAHTKSFRR
jgi:hypothetical protein